MKSTYLLEITHKNPLPRKVPMTDILADRIYNYCFAQGCEISVAVKLVDTLEVREPDDLPSMRELESQGQRTDSPVRLRVVQAGDTFDVLPAAAQVPEVPACGAGGDMQTGGVA